jgi:hypothetical protein
MDKLERHPDDRSCKLCILKANMLDPVFVSEFVAWGRPDHKGKCQGHICFYCNRVFVARFKIMFKTIDELLTAMGKDKDLKQKFSQMRSFMLDKMVAATDRSLRITWDSADKADTALVHFQESISALEHPEDEALVYEDYCKIHGDPLRNGKGHTRQTVNGLDLVILPGARVYKIKRTDQMRAALTTTVDDGSLQLSETHMQDQFRDLSDAIMMPSATGVCVDSLFATPTRTMATPLPMLANASSPPSSSNEAPSRALPNTSPFGFRVGAVASPPSGGSNVGVAASACDDVQLASDAVKPRGQKKGNAAKSKPGGLPPKAADSKTGAKGRPKRDLIVTFEKFLSKFIVADEDDSFFCGKEQHQHKQWLQTLLDDVEKALASTGLDATNEAKHHTVSKQLNVILDLTKCCPHPRWLEMDVEQFNTLLFTRSTNATDDIFIYVF